MKIQVATLMIESSETDSNLYYTTKFTAPDPFIFLKIGDEQIMIMSDLEVDRAKDQARVDTVLSYTIYEDKARKQGIAEPKTIDILHEFLGERGIKVLTVPSYFGIRYALLLEDKGYNIEVKSDPFFEERTKKSEEEVAFITDTLRFSEYAIDRAIGFIRSTEIRGGGSIFRG